MGFRDWILGFLGASEATKDQPLVHDAASAPPRDPIDEEAAGLNFYSAIEAHQRWKVRLLAVIEGDTSEGLSVAVIGRDDQCALGKWIHGHNGHLAATPEFERLRRNHAFFHQCAARVLGHAQAGQKDEALGELKSGPYARASADVIQDLAVMYRRATEDEAKLLRT